MRTPSLDLRAANLQNICRRARTGRTSAVGRHQRRPSSPTRPRGRSSSQITPSVRARCFLDLRAHVAADHFPIAVAVHRRSESTVSCKRDMLKYMYWRTAEPTRDWVGSAQPFDFHRADWNSPVGPTLLVFRQHVVRTLSAVLGRSTAAGWATASRSRGDSTGSVASRFQRSSLARRRVRAPWHCSLSCAFVTEVQLC